MNETCANCGERIKDGETFVKYGNQAQHESCPPKPKSFEKWDPYACPSCGMQMSHSYGIGYVCDRCRRY